ncbi:MAG: hypothetical protein AABW79_05210 [Nanoarchaeota archaeon]
MLIKSLVFLKHLVELLYFKIIPPKEFIFNGKNYRYFYALYNATWTAERKIEIPIFEDIVKSSSGEILEVGNVLNHYFPFNHEVIDKYEIAKGVINVDVIDFKPKRKYDLIVSISTIEHVGFDEKNKDKDKPEKAILHLLGLLKTKGKLIISYPVGYNPGLDATIENPPFKIKRKWIIPIRAEGLTKRPVKNISIVEIAKK